ncbi:protein ALP1-like [Senna tora]|uniref:Protein ALP1-like n=1 Tax=Senna tora TaxID=362788 RepID=A0A834TQK0_9FABA|nr:protein ALP1-like [Senna tora]
MYKATFDRLCSMFKAIGGLRPTRNMLVDEEVALFLHVLAHHLKNMVVQFHFGRSGESISQYFHIVLKAMMRLDGELFKKPEPIRINSADEIWKWFKGCLGALDGTHVKIKVSFKDQPMYQNQKGDITTNVLVPNVLFTSSLNGSLYVVQMAASQVEPSKHVWTSLGDKALAEFLVLMRQEQKYMQG